MDGGGEVEELEVRAMSAWRGTTRVSAVTPLVGVVCAAACVAVLLPAGCARGKSTTKAANTGAPILLYNGTGTSRNDVAAIAELLAEKGLAYDTADSSELGEMSDAQLAAYRLIIFPGGNYIKMGDGLSAETTRRVREAVRRGVNYLGICAGGLLAGSAKCNSLDLTSGVKFGFYAVVNRGVHKSAVPIACAEMPVIEHYWEDGPEFSGWGLVVGKYPDGTPAIVEGAVGEGWVILCGVHPEAPESWRAGMGFSTTAGDAHAYTGTLVEAALKGKRLAHY
jgi:hypothetical protein